MPECAICGAEFQRKKKSTARTCSRACAAALAWRAPKARRRRLRGMRRYFKSHACRARAAEFNRRRWSRPGEREKLSAWNKRRWANPASRADNAKAIGEAQRNPKYRRLVSRRMKKRWKDPAARRKLMEGMIASHRTPAVRAKLSENMRKRWRNRKTRKALLAATKKNSRKGASMIRGKKQSPDHVRKRFAARKDGRNMRKAA